MHKLRQDIRLRRDHAVHRAWKLGIILNPSRRERLTVDVDQLRAMDVRWRLRAHRYRLTEAACPGVRGTRVHPQLRGLVVGVLPGRPVLRRRYEMDRAFEQHYGGDYLRLWGDARNWPAPMQTASAWRATLQVGGPALAGVGSGMRTPVTVPI